MKKSIFTLLLSIPFLMSAQVNSDDLSTEYPTSTYNKRIDTVYKAPQDNEVFYFNGYEAPEKVEPDFVLKKNGKAQEFEIDKNCDVNNPTSCVSLYHYPMKEGHKWFIKSSVIVDDPLQITYGQRVGKEGEVVISTVEIGPGKVRDMGYGKYKDSKEREVWIISASFN